MGGWGTVPKKPGRYWVYEPGYTNKHLGVHLALLSTALPSKALYLDHRTVKQALKQGVKFYGPITPPDPPEDEPVKTRRRAR